MTDTIKIDFLGAQGDGAGKDTKGQPVFVPFSLPGEVVEAQGHGARRKLHKLKERSDDRVEAICKHFETCGGCQLQHASGKFYQRWKRELLVSQLKLAGIDHEPEPLVTFPTGSRRRAAFSARQGATGLIFGFSERDSNTIINIEECPVLVRDIADQMEVIATSIAPLVPGRETAKVSVLACENGLDLSVETKAVVSRKDQETAATVSAGTRIIRLTVNGETVIERASPILKFNEADAYPSPGCFVQAVADAEKAMAELVSGHLKKSKHVADLFCGIGTFALRLAQNSKVTAIEGDAELLGALDKSWKASGGRLKQIHTEKRDLFRRPLMAQEMKKIDGIVFDPPRAGAEVQARQIARSSVPRVAAVSCNPQTLVADLKILLAAGYLIKRIVPIDQFTFTPHLEVVVLLER